jgi:hypothetical protein
MVSSMSLSLPEPRRFFLRLHRRNNLQIRRLHISSYLGQLRLNIPLRHLQQNRGCLTSFVPTSSSPWRLPNSPGSFLSTPLFSRSVASIAQGHPRPTGFVCIYRRCQVPDCVPLRVSRDSLAELKALTNIIQSSIEQIENDLSINNLTFPSPDSTFSLESEAPRMRPDIQAAGSLIASAAAQLISLARPSQITLFEISLKVSLKFFGAIVGYC